VDFLEDKNQARNTKALFKRMISHRISYFTTGKGIGTGFLILVQK
jgi:hypothetical protein